MLAALDLNADVGDGFPYDGALLEVISSANVACGFHAGEPQTMRELCEACAERGVAVGAQVSYRDRAGFGRRRVEIGYDDLRAGIDEQLDLLADAAGRAGVRVAYLKPHGALYNRVFTDAAQSRAVVDAAAAWRLPVLGLPGSVLLSQAGEAGLPVARELFADRGYTSQGTLVPRSAPEALVTDPLTVRARVRQFLDRGSVSAVDGTAVKVVADSLCVHGDTPDAPALARAVEAELREHAVAVRAPW